ncbi:MULTISPECIES: DUF6174 domain-containing protein [unclassified Carboxylicivirga]|uniref:DUF6174 domain-containing protein n=1 Tax=Carboxylicivirga TaxID=1628153 RepID=UPI003D32B737
MKNIFLFLLSFVIVSCGDTDDSIGLLFNQDSYNSNRELWENSGKLDYSFTQEQSATYNGGQPKLITVVKNGELDTIYIQTNESGDSVKYLVHYETIDDVYDYINSTVESCNEQINSSDNQMNGAKIEVEYDASYYFPAKIICTGYYPNGYVGGLSTQIFITDFEEN